MTIVHLNPEQIKTERRKLLSDDVYIIAVDALREMHKQGHMELSHVECFLSARQFATLLISLPNVLEGIDDELDDLCDEAGSSDEAMIVSMIATFIIQAANRANRSIDARPIIIKIMQRWTEHPLFLPLLANAAHTEEVRWAQGKHLNLLEYELEEMKDEGSEEISEFMTEIEETASKMGADTIKETLLVLNKYNDTHGQRYQKHIDSLYEKLDDKTRQQFNIERINDIHGNDNVNIGN